MYKWIADELEERGWSNNELGRRADISSGHISQIMSGQRPVTYEICMAIAKAFGERPEKILRLAGLLPSSSGKMDDLNQDEKELVEAYRELRPWHKPIALGLLKDLLNRWRDIK